jgi:hypothetical protein
MWRFNSRCRENILVQIRHWNLDGSDSGRTGGSFSVTGFSGKSGAIGFLMPWPPLISSIGMSGGIPSWKYSSMILTSFQIKLKIEFYEINIFSNEGWFSILLVRLSTNLGNILRVALF